MELNHPNHNGNRFTVCPATSTEYSPKTRTPRVSKVFYVLCLNTRRFGLRQHRLYGRAPLRGLNFTVQLYAHKEGMPSCTNGNDTCRKLHPLFNLQIPPEPVSVKDTHQRKEEINKNVYVKHSCLQIFLINTFYHRTFKKLWYMF